MLVQKINSVRDLQKWIQSQILPRLTEKYIILLSGQMGAGKTEFVKLLVELLGGEAATSPSFALHNTYQTAKMNVEHLDLFRLENEEDLESIGFWDLFENEKSLVVIEWSEKVSSQKLPMTWQKLLVHIKLLDNDSREISYEFK